MVLDLARLTQRRAGPTVVFFGAGAGMADGLPSTEEMASRIRDALLQRVGDIAFATPPSLDAFLECGDAESLMALLSDVNEGLATWGVGPLLYRILSWAAARSADLPGVGVDGLRRRLLEHLYARESELHVMTTNWDTSLDTIVRELAAPGPVLNQLFPDTEAEARASAGKPIHYYKLNGSPDWFVCSPCGTLATAEQVRLAGRIPAGRSHLDVDPFCTLCGAWMPRVMVLPSRGDAFHPLGFDANRIEGGQPEWRHVKLLSLQTQATMVFEVAEEIVFAGYSLPPYDTAIRDIVQYGLSTNFYVRRGAAKIHVVARGSDATRANFESVLGEIPFDYFSSGLDGYLEEIGR